MTQLDLKHMVDIFLASDDYAAPLLLLSIPPSDIRRLSLRPLKWLRFVVFTVCGARGDLYSQDDGTVVNYDITSIDDIIGPYFYRSDGKDFFPFASHHS